MLLQKISNLIALTRPVKSTRAHSAGENKPYVLKHRAHKSECVHKKKCAHTVRTQYLFALHNLSIKNLIKKNNNNI